MITSFVDAWLQSRKKQIAAFGSLNYFTYDISLYFQKQNYAILNSSFYRCTFFTGNNDDYVCAKKAMWNFTFNISNNHESLEKYTSYDVLSTEQLQDSRVLSYHNSYMGISNRAFLIKKILVLNDFEMKINKNLYYR